MFEIQRQQHLNEIHWEPEDDGLYKIETTSEAPDANTSPGSGLDHSAIKEGDIDPWLAQTGEKRVRILCISKPKKHQSAKLSVTRDTFVKVETAFRLSKTTAPALFNSSGVLSRFSEYDPVSKKPKRIRIVVKSKQKVGVGNWLCSLCHEYATGSTDALICSEGMLTPLTDDPSSTIETQISLFVARLEQLPQLWQNPILVPALLISLFSDRIQANRLKVADKLVDLENEMGVTFAGRSKAKRPLKNWPEDLDIKQVTIGLNSTGASILYLSQTCIWAQDAVAFLIKMAEETGLYHPDLWLTSMELKEALEYESSALDGVSLTMKTKKERIQAQLNVLYSAASQKENAIALQYSRMAQEQNDIALQDVRLNTKIATSTKKDSIAMAIFTFITALFLPGTYVASLFSMSMFDWLHDDSDKTTVSPLFWVYWLVTIPLTAVVLGGWWIWYKRADQQWQKDTGYSLNGSLIDDKTSVDTEASAPSVTTLKTDLQSPEKGS